MSPLHSNCLSHGFKDRFNKNGRILDAALRGFPVYLSECWFRIQVVCELGNIMTGNGGYAKKIKSKYNSATAEKALPVGKQPAQQQPDAACQPGNEWAFRYELRYPSSCGPSLPAFIPTSASHSSQSIV